MYIPMLAAMLRPPRDRVVRLEAQIARYTDKHEQYATEKEVLVAKITAGMASRWRDDGEFRHSFFFFSFFLVIPRTQRS